MSVGPTDQERLVLNAWTEKIPRGIATSAFLKRKQGFARENFSLAGWISLECHRMDRDNEGV